MRAFLGLLTVVVVMCTGVATAQAVSPVVTQGFQLKWGTNGNGDGQFDLPQGVAVDGSGNVYVADANNNRVEKFDSSGAFVAKLGSGGSGDGQFSQPEGVAVDGFGNVYVADSGNNRVERFNSSGVFSGKWGASGTADGQFQGPFGIAVASGNVYVTDATNDRVQKFDTSGGFLGKWGTSGFGDGQFNFPEGVGVDGAGNVYVADSLNDRVQKFDPSGAFLTKWGTTGSGDGQFNQPVSVAGDGAGNVYVADLNNHRVQLFDSSGAFLGKWGASGSGDGQFNKPFGIGVDGSGNVFVSDSFNNRVEKFTPLRLAYTERAGAVAADPRVQVTDVDSVNLAGATVAITGNYQNGVDVLAFADQNGITGSFDASTGVLTLTGSATVAQYQTALQSVTYRAGSTHPSTAQRTISFTASDGTNSNTVGRPVAVAAVDDPPGLSPGTFGTFELKFGSLGAGDGQLSAPGGVAVDGSGNAYVIDAGNNRVEKFDPSGAFVTKWGTSGTADGQFDTPEGVAVDGSGNVYVVDTNNNRVQKFDSSGTFLGKWGSAGGGNGQFNSVEGIAVDGSGNVYVADTGNNRVQKFDSSGAFATKWGTSGPGDGQFSSPFGVAVDGSGNVYVGDTAHQRIQKFDSSGAFITKWGSFGSGDGQFESPSGVAVDATGNVFVADLDNARVEKFDPSGAFLGKWGSSGTGDGQFMSPVEVAVDSAGRVFVSDFAKNQEQRFGSSTPSFTEGDAALGVDPLIDVADADSADLTGATVQITSGFRAGQDVLSFTSANGITGSFAGDTLTLSGTATVAQYETALRSVTFNTGDDPGSATRTIAFRASSGSGLGNTVARRIAVTPVIDPPVVTTTAGGLTYTEGDGQVAADPGLTITDADSGNLSGANVAISGGFVSGQDVLSFPGGSGISGSFDTGTGVLTLTGTATVADYQAALRSVKYENTSQSPSGTRTVGFQVTDDSSTAGNTATRGISLVSVPDAPVVTTSTGATTFRQRGAAKVVDGGLAVSDADDASLIGAQVRISTGFQRGDRLSLAGQPAVSGTYDPKAGVLTVTGVATVAEYQAALRAVKFSTANGGAAKTVEFTARDIGLVSSPATKALAITRVPTVSIVDSKVRVSGTRVPVRLRCQGPSGSRCRGTLTLVPSSGRVSKAAFDIAAGATKRVSARTPATSRALLARRHKAVVGAVARTNDGRSVTRRITLVGA